MIFGKLFTRDRKGMLYIFYESLPIAEDPTTLSARTIRLGGSLPGHHHLPADRDPSAGDPADQSQAGKAGASYHC